jgi:ribonuclease Z
MEFTLFGTSSMVPTAKRNHSGALLSFKDEKILIDCGEGTQRQFRKAKITPTKITKILLTHWHGDHILGLPGLFLTLGANNYGKDLEVYGPKGTKMYMKKLMSFFVPRQVVKFKVFEVESGVFFENEFFSLEAIPLEHSTHTVGYAFVEKDRRKIDMEKLEKKGVKSGPILKKLQRGEDIEVDGKKIKVSSVTSLIKGKKIALVTDTRKCANAIKIAKNADVLFCESTYLHDRLEMAKERGHMTATQAGQIAKQAKVKKLVLIHFSQRYKDVAPLEAEAKKVFKNVEAGVDLKTFLI